MGELEIKSAPAEAGAERPDEGRPSRRQDIAAVVLLVASLVAMFWKVVFTSALFFYRDVYNYTFPTARLIHDVCRQGFLPYWNPYLNYGQPVLANPNVLFFYPFTLLVVLLPVDIAYTLHFIVHFAIAAIGVYVLARSWGQSWLAAFVAAFLCTFSGPMLSLGNFYNECACAAWIPWALLFTHRGVQRRGMRAWVLLVVVFSLQWLAGEPMTMLATFGLCFAYAVYMLTRTAAIREPGLATQNSKLKTRAPRISNFQFPISSFVSSSGGRGLVRAVSIFFLVGLGMLGLCAMHFLPASALLAQSRRGLQGLRFAETANWAVNPLSFLQMLIPNFFGSEVESPTGWIWLISHFNLPYFLSIFLGFIPCFFALAGWAIARDRRRNFVAGGAGVFLLLSFGNFTPVFALAYLLIPPLAVVRYPVKLLVPFTFLLAILAGWGFDALRSTAAPWKTSGARLLIPLKVFLACVLAVVAVAWLLPGVIISPTRWALARLGQTAFNLHQMPDFLVTMLRYQLPGVAGFCLGALVLSYGLIQRQRWARPGLLAFALLAMGQLAAVNYNANPTVPKTFFTFHPPVLDNFKDPPGTYRVASFWPVVQTPETHNLQTYINFDKVPEAAGLGQMAQGAFQARLQLATGSMWNDVEENINLDIERSLPPYVYDIEIYQNRPGIDALHVDCMLGRTNVKYIIRPDADDSSVMRLMGSVFNGSPESSYLYQDACFVPRAYVAANALFSTSSDETLEHLADPSFDALNTVIVAGSEAEAGASTLAPAEDDGKGHAAAQPVSRTLQAGGGVNAANASVGSSGEVEIVHRDPNSVTLRARLARPAYVVLLDRYDDGWLADVDGHASQVFRANQIFRAVYAAAGSHEIRFYYRQRGLRSGIVISILTCVLLSILFIIN